MKRTARSTAHAATVTEPPNTEQLSAKKLKRGIVLTITVSIDPGGWHVAKVYGKDSEIQERAEATLIAFHSLRRAVPNPESILGLLPYESETIH